MSIDVADAIKTGFDRLGTRNAAIIVSVYFVLNVLNRAVSDTLISKSMSQLPGETSTAASLALPIPGYVAGFLLIPVIAASAVLGVAALRLFSTDERDVIHRKLYAENIGKPVINVIAGGIAFGLLMLLAVFIPILPGVLASSAGFNTLGIALGLLGALVSLAAVVTLLVKLYFWTASVAIDNKSFIEAFKSSWELTKHNVLSVGLLLLVIISISLLVGAVFSIPQVMGYEVIGSIISGLGGAVASTLTAAIIATAYGQLKDVREGEPEEKGESKDLEDDEEVETEEEQKDEEEVEEEPEDEDE